MLLGICASIVAARYSLIAVALAAPLLLRGVTSFVLAGWLALVATREEAIKIRWNKRQARIFCNTAPSMLMGRLVSVLLSQSECLIYIARAWAEGNTNDDLFHARARCCSDVSNTDKPCGESRVDGQDRGGLIERLRTRPPKCPSCTHDWNALSWSDRDIDVWIHGSEQVVRGDVGWRNILSRACFHTVGSGFVDFLVTRDALAYIASAYGELKAASRWLAAEGFIRTAVVVPLMLLVGVSGIPVATIVACSFSIFALSHLVSSRMGLHSRVMRGWLPTLGVWGAVCLGLSLFTAAFLARPSIRAFGLVGAAVVVGCCGILLCAPTLRDSLVFALRRVAPRAATRFSATRSEVCDCVPQDKGGPCLQVGDNIFRAPPRKVSGGRSVGHICVRA